jgi:hypothetical protein
MFTVITLLVLFLSSFVTTIVKVIDEVAEIVYFASRSNNEQESDFNIEHKTLTDVVGIIYALCLHFRNFALSFSFARWFLIIRQNKA